MRELTTAMLVLTVLAGCPTDLDDADPHAGDVPGADDAGGTGEMGGVTGEAGDPGASAGDAEADAGSLLGDELSGMPVVQTERGAWIVRSTDGGGMTGGSGGLGEALDEDRSSGLWGGGGRRRGSRRSTAIGAASAGPAPTASRSEEVPAAAPRDGAAEPRRDVTSGAVGGAPGAAPMRAGSTDDNVDFEEFVEFLARWSDRPAVASQWDALDVTDRRAIRVVAADGDPVPAAHVTIVDEGADRIVWSGTTYGDGVVPFYPRVAVRGSGADVLAVPEGGFIVQASLDGAVASTRWNGDGEEVELTLEGARAEAETIPLDVLFVIDTTGSMGDEIGRIKGTLLRVTERLRGLEQEFDLRYGAVLYRDIHDDYVTKAHPFTGDIEEFSAALQSVQASGGGDGPESLNQGLAQAVSMPGWRDGAAKVMFVIADAPPHMDYAGDTPYGDSLIAAVDQGVRIHAVAASGLDDFGTVVFRQMAQFTRGRFIFIEYGTTEASAASHGVTGTVASNNLDDIIYAQIARELAEWGRPPQTLVTR